MRFLIRLVAVIAAVSVVGTVWFVAALAAAGGLPALLASGWLGGLTIAGWVIALVAGPVAAIQLWRLRPSGRRAGILLFGSGLAYHLLGLLLALRSPDASIEPILSAATVLAVPLVLLLWRPARVFLEGSTRSGPGG